jgi:TonB family protein
MSAGTSLALEKTPRRGFPRYPVKVPLDVIALRAGVPQNLPGRCTDLSEGGIGAMVAGDLFVGQQVAVELRLPHVGVPVRAQACVRYHGGLRCGFEFAGLSTEQRELIRYWAFRIAPQTSERDAPKTEPAKPEAPAGPLEHARPKIRIRRRRFNLLLAAMLALALVGWWQWQRSWSELEKHSFGPQAPLQVPPATMAMRIVYKVDPAYPEEARAAGTQGLVVLDALIAPDGAVKRLQPVTGDELLAKAASDAVKQWRFEPYRTSGRAVEVETTIAVQFSLN